MTASHTATGCRQGGVLIALSLDGVQHLCAGTGAIAGHDSENQACHAEGPHTDLSAPWHGPRPARVECLMPRQLQGSARFRQDGGGPLMTVALSQTSGFARSTISCGPDLMLQHLLDQVLHDEGLEQPRAISLGRPTGPSFSSGPTTITERPE